MSNFPTSLDSFTNPSSTSDTSTVSHSSQHTNINDAVAALEAKVGVTSSAVTTSLTYKLTNASSTDPGHLHTLASGTSGTLTVSRGGTGATTLTGIVVGNGTSAFSVVTAPSGTIVGTTDSQALTNKTLNGLTVTSSTGTLTVTNAKTLTVSDTTTLAISSITLANGAVISFPAVTDTMAVLGTAQTYTATLTEKQVNWTNNAIAASGNAATVPITHRLHTVTNNSAATLTITMTTTSAVDGQLCMIRILDFSGVAQTITWVNTENSSVSAPTTSNGSTTLFLTVGFIYNSSTSKWRCIATS